MSKAARDLAARCPRSWGCAEDRSEPIRGWVSEDRRSSAARWGAWAPKVRHPFGITQLGLRWRVRSVELGDVTAWPAADHGWTARAGRGGQTVLQAGVAELVDGT